MTRRDLKEAVTKKYKEGQKVPIRIEIEGKRGYHSTTAEIITFNPDTILTQHDGFKESFTYYDFIKMTTPRTIRQSTLYIPDKVKMRFTGA